ncbi:MAG: RNA 2',3'-cyclic phosphodiesterase [bacterium]|nr:RNA 2',3'-cyclic phosphodiesterase [bacterium]
MARRLEARTLGLMAERMFLAAALDDNCRHAIATHLEASLAGDYLPGRPVPPENWHITLRFLGPTEAVQRDAIVAHLDQHLLVEPFRIRFTELGGFPKRSRASVLWLGLGGAIESLTAVAAECEAAAEAAGLEPEGRPFHPHMTLSRVRPPSDMRSLIDVVPPAKIALDVGEVTLYRSVLGRGPAGYEVVERVSLL